MTMNAARVIVRLVGGKGLNETEARELFLKLFSEKISALSAKAILLLLARKGESADELLGCLSALRSLEPPKDTGICGLMDTCGTGGDSSSSINVSTLAALVVAGAGGHVAKHGNRAISSKCGSSDLMEALGVKLDAKPAKMIRAIQRCGIGYFHAPFYHPVFAKVQGLRRQLGVRTIFNLLGPLVNPNRLHYQLVGVSNRRIFRLYADVLKRTGLKRAGVCHGRDGLDEISTRTKTDLAVIERGRLRQMVIDPRRLGLAMDNWNYRAGSIAANRRTAIGVLTGKLKGPIRDLVVINAAIALYIAGMAKNIRKGMDFAQKSIDDGRAYRALLGLKLISNR